jgi:aminocarboxymuconate-semialdehyde decarboxylase
VSIDVHNHVIPPEVIDLVAGDSRYGVTLADGTWSSANIGGFPLTPAWSTPDGKLQEMDEKELDRALLSVAPKPLYYYELDAEPQLLMATTANDGLARFCEGHDDRLRWLAHLPLGAPDLVVAELDRANGLGASGVQLGTSAAGRSIDDPAYEPLWARLEELGLAVFLHPAYEPGGPDFAIDLAQGMPFSVTEALHRLIYSGVLDRHTSLSVVAALGGGFFPYTAGRLAHYASYLPSLEGLPADPWAYVGRILFDSHVHSVEVLRFLIEIAGSENVVIGTDCSFMSATPSPMGELRAATSDVETIARVADGNAERLFWKERA